MTITRKKEIQEIVRKGAPVEDPKESKKAYKYICQKIRLDLLKYVDEAVEDRPGMNRSAWIQEAIKEKIDRLNDANKN